MKKLLILILITLLLILTMFIGIKGVTIGKIEILVGEKRKKLSSFDEYLEYRGLSKDINNPKAPKRKIK